MWGQKGGGRPPPARFPEPLTGKERDYGLSSSLRSAPPSPLASGGKKGRMTGGERGTLKRKDYCLLILVLLFILLIINNEIKIHGCFPRFTKKTFFNTNTTTTQEIAGHVVKTYANADTQKLDILNDNKNKSGVYR